jgi:hypothetical protein
MRPRFGCGSDRYEARLQDAVVIGVHRHTVVERIAGLAISRSVSVEVDEGVLAKGVAVAARQEEVLLRLHQFNGGGRIVGGGTTDRRNPPMVVGIARWEAAVGLERLASQVAALVSGLTAEYADQIREQGFRWSTRARTLKDLRQQPESEGELVALAGQTQGLHLAQWQQGAQIVAAVERAEPLNRAAARVGGAVAAAS